MREELPRRGAARRGRVAVSLEISLAVITAHTRQCTPPNDCKLLENGGRVSEFLFSAFSTVFATVRAASAFLKERSSDCLTRGQGPGVEIGCPASFPGSHPLSDFYNESDAESN